MEREAYSDTRDLARRLIRGFGLLALIALVIWLAAQVLLYAFAAILWAVFLCACIDWVRDHTRLGRKWSYAVVVVFWIGVVLVAAWILAPRVIAQLNLLAAELPRSLAQVRRFMNQTYWGQQLLAHTPHMVQDMLSRATTVLTWSIEGIAALLVVLVAGLYLAADPDHYRIGIERLLPQGERKRAAKVFVEVGYTLRWWILGQLVPMVFLGIASIIGLSVMGVPLAFTLGLFTGVMIFIPYIGSLISMLVAMLIALSQGPIQAVYVMILFLAIHTTEGYFLTPMVQRRAVLLPPALTILTQMFLGVLMGFPGLALATPLTAAGLVLIRMLYLGEEPEHH